ncbi:MAG: hypothetical protein KDM63_16320, partial [Verrucomicrobiae bacterium]|nr:hypothetical protein [Verrucomicrobiae bacterium]
IDVRLDEIVLRALSDSPELRWQSATELRTQVETIAQTGPSEMPPPLGDVVPPPPPRPMPASSAITPEKRPERWPLWVALGLLVPAVPMSLAGLWALGQVLADSHWSPTLPELILELFLWTVSPLLLGVSVYLLFRWARQGDRAESRKRKMTVTVIGTAVLATLIVVPMSYLSMQSRQRLEMRQQLDLARRNEAISAKVARDIQRALDQQMNPPAGGNDPGSQNRSEGMQSMLRESLAAANREVEKAKERTASIQAVAVKERASFPVFLGIVAVGVVILGFGGLIFLALKSGGGAKGCLIAFLLVLGLVIGLIVIRFFSLWNLRESHGDAVTVVNSSSEVALTLFDPRLGDDGRLTFSYEVSQAGLENEIWVVVESTILPGKVQAEESSQADDSSDVAAPDHRHLENTLANLSLPLNGRGKVDLPLDGVAGNDQVIREIQAQLREPVRRVSLRPGRLTELLSVATGPVGVALEYRPQRAISTPSAWWIHLNDLTILPSEGRILVSWDSVSVPAGFELVLETEGAEVAWQIGESSYTPVTELFPARPVGDAIERGRLGDRTGGTLCFSVPAGKETDWIRRAPPAELVALPVTDASPTVLFDFVDQKTGQPFSAKLRLEKR